MPKPGQKSVTLKEEVYQKVKKKARKEGKSVAAFITELILSNCKKEEEVSE